ncbi:MFS transporter [Kineococcus gynurae]|uniref:MFS transporter n=1 Tax=Kineococcus gynurae TaxID=452979 RepID=A0ABV5LXC4_9ACTN
MPTLALRRARLAVGACFVANAFVYANIVPRLPEIKAELGLSNAALGTAIAALPTGSLIAALTSGFFIARFGSGRVAAVGMAVAAGVLATATIAPSWGVLAAVLLVTGALDAVVDVAQNAHGLRVQRHYGRSIINAFHGMWSIGAVAGGLLGSAAAGLSVPLPVHLLVVAVLVVLAMLLAQHWMLPGPDEADGPVVQAADPASPPVPTGRVRWPRAAVLALAALGLLAACGAFVEDAGSSWSTLYLQSLAAAPAVAGFGYVGLATGMTVGRFTGDWFVDRWGAAAVVRVGGVLTAVGMGTALLVGSVPVTIVGFVLAGLGVATLVPAVFHASDEIPGLPRGVGLSVSNWLLRLGLLACPPLVGLLADATSLRVALIPTVLAGAGAVVLAGWLRPRPTLAR